jgi:ring-1,2-phenylacetyl-CoA epoxidase subunit PaaD
MVSAVADATDRIPLLPEEQWRRQQRRRDSSAPELWAVLDQVLDPEIPVLTIWELGVLIDIRRERQGIVVVITPTYSGCPAVEAIEADIRTTLGHAGYMAVEIRRQLAPAWTTDWMGDAARAKLEAFGIAPPPVPAVDARCPRCGSGAIQAVSSFSSTACKALYRCSDCLESFDLFKRI